MNQKKDEDKLLNSDYDGIQEYDNDLPKWWLYLFYLTIIGGVIYSFYYHYVPGASNEDRLASQMAEMESKKGIASASRSEKSDADLIQLASTDAVRVKGKEIYLARCAVCHAAEGQGLVGPNLTDKYWIHGGKISDIKKVVVDGVLEKGMLAWKGVLTDDEIDQVVGFVWSIRNTNVANGKAQEGVPVED